MKKLINNQEPLIKEGLYSAEYFLKTTKILAKYPNDIITMQFFQRKNNVVLVGIKEVINLLESVIEEADKKLLTLWHLPEGSIINNLEPVLKIEGPYYLFGYLEGIIDGILSRQSSIATKCRNIIQAAPKKDFIFMADRSDHYINQANDGYAASIGGFKNFVTKAQVSLILDNDYKVLGTIPHALIQAHKGDLIRAIKNFREIFPKERLVALVDYKNDSIRDSLMVARQFPDLYAVRVDTPKNLKDKFFDNNPDYEKYDNIELRGVNKYLIHELRNQLDKEGFSKVKIIVSSGFESKKILDFEKNQVPVDIYGVGSSLLKKSISFTGDCVKINGISEAKFGRQNINSDRLIRIKLK